MDWVTLHWDRPTEREDGTRLRKKEIYYYTVYHDNFMVATPTQTRYRLLQTDCGEWYVTATDRDSRESKPSNSVYSCLWRW